MTDKKPENGDDRIVPKSEGSRSPDNRRGETRISRERLSPERVFLDPNAIREVRLAKMAVSVRNLPTLSAGIKYDEDLGELEDVFATKSQGAAVFAALIISGFFVLLYAIPAVVSGDPDSIVTGLFVACFFGGIIAAVVIYTALRRKPQILVFTNGFIEVAGKAKDVWYWDQIVSINGAVRVGRDTFMGTTLTLEREGSTLSLNAGIRNFYDLADLIHERALESMYPWARDMLESGSRLNCGTIAISKQAIFYHDQSLPWSQVDDVYLELDPSNTPRTIVVIDSRNHYWYRQEIGTFPNAELFMTLARELMKGEFRKPNAPFPPEKGE